MNILKVLTVIMLLSTSINVFASADSIGSIALPAPFRDTEVLNVLVEQTVQAAVKRNPGSIVDRSHRGFIMVIAPIKLPNVMLEGVPQCPKHK
jgi:hypothetical protein